MKNIVPLKQYFIHEIFWKQYLLGTAWQSYDVTMHFTSAKCLLTKLPLTPRSHLRAPDMRRVHPMDV